jgi:hypothetical protein
MSLKSTYRVGQDLPRENPPLTFTEKEIGLFLSTPTRLNLLKWMYYSTKVMRVSWEVGADAGLQPCKQLQASGKLGWGVETYLVVLKEAVTAPVLLPLPHNHFYISGALENGEVKVAPSGVLTPWRSDAFSPWLLIFLALLCWCPLNDFQLDPWELFGDSASFVSLGDSSSHWGCLDHRWLWISTLLMTPHENGWGCTKQQEAEVFLVHVFLKSWLLKFKICRPWWPHLENILRKWKSTNPFTGILML